MAKVAVIGDDYEGYILVDPDRWPRDVVEIDDAELAEIRRVLAEYERVQARLRELIRLPAEVRT